MFDNELSSLVAETKKHYEQTMYKAALKSGYYDFTAARDFYREVTKAAGLGMHEDLVKRYIELQALLITPVAPHWSDYIWQEVLSNKDTVQNALWPEVPEANPSLTAAREYVRVTSSNITSAEGAQVKRLAKGKAMLFDPKKDKKITIFVAQEWPAWQKRCVLLYLLSCFFAPFLFLPLISIFPITLINRAKNKTNLSIDTSTSSALHTQTSTSNPSRNQSQKPNPKKQCPSSTA
jgi:hypothetical protein